ncbi:DUF3375 domain-containing protein [Isoptericola sp. S6320L]|uniref:DUF3375 domain-containing protein n=1 Tax=Isoptericola sp. S6320L TaxID=2926411 RepID=UPI001FF6149C|nr:DUF3375 domain-containing protein [Isoptericola sp. S6320L]MCK0117739.1 DUF3375 domain-containing protein [Isoptericola sp. S6320L]
MRAERSEALGRRGAAGSDDRGAADAPGRRGATSARLATALAGVERAFAAPTLGLLHKAEAPLVVAVLRCVFTPDRPTVATEQLHVELDDLLGELRTAVPAGDASAGRVPGVPDEPARVLCTRWVRERWLVRSLDDAGAERYRLSSYAAEALDVVSRTQGTRGLVSESRIRTLLVTVEDLARDAHPDRESRMQELRSRIDEAQAELGRLEAGGEVESVEPARLTEQYDHVLSLVRELPTDFARVAESISALQRDMVTRLRQDERTTGVVVADYLDASENLLERTPEGRAFAGAMELLGDPDLLDGLEQRVRSILEHPFAAELPADHRAVLQTLRAQLVGAIEVVLAAQARASRTVTAQIRHHNPLRDRELDDALREATAAMAEWFPASGRAARVEPLRWFERARPGRLRTALHDLRPETPPDDLEEWTDDHSPGDEIADLRAMGGPQHAEILAHLGTLAGPTSIGRAFAAGPAFLRRPVELLGYLDVAVSDADGGTSGDVPATGLERVTATRADGTVRDFVLPRTPIRRTDD